MTRQFSSKRYREIETILLNRHANNHKAALTKLFFSNTIKDEFLSKYWEKKILHAKGGFETPHDLYTFSQLCSDISKSKFLIEDLRFIDASENELLWVNFAKKNQHTYNPKRILKFLHQRGSLAVNNMEKYNKRIVNLIQAIQKMFGGEVSTHLFFTPPGARTFKAHWDSYHVIMLQLSGEKNWILGNPLIKLPFDPYHPNSLVKHSEIDRIKRVQLHKGETLYIPKGYVHEGRASRGGHSLHLSLIIKAPTWLDIVNDRFKRTTASLVNNLEFRKSCGPVFGKGDFVLERRKKRNILLNLVVKEFVRQWRLL